jgi:hypothetical protein
MHVGLADQDGAGALQPHHDLGVRFRYILAQKRRRGGGGDAGNIDIVLHRHRHGIGVAAVIGGLERLLVHHRQDGLQMGIERLDPPMRLIDRGMRGAVRLR